MSVTEGSYSPKNYNCNGILTDFDFDWRIFGEEDLVVKVYDSDGNETTLALTTEYTAAKAGNDWTSGGTITTVATYPSGYTLTIERAVARKQPADYVANDNFPAETHEAIMDRIILIIQELQNLNDRMPRNPADDPAMDMTMPVQNSRKERYLYFDVDGKPTAAGQSLLGGITVTAFIETLLDDADATTAMTTLLNGIIDLIKSSHIDWGSGADQVDLDEMPDGTTYGKVKNANLTTGQPSEVLSIEDQGGVATNGLKCKIIEISDWNMDTNNTRAIAHGLGTDYKKIRAISGIIRSDDDSIYSPIPCEQGVTGTPDVYFYAIGSTTISIARTTGGSFDDAQWSATTLNRGWVTIWYEA